MASSTWECPGVPGRRWTCSGTRAAPSTAWFPTGDGSEGEFKLYGRAREVLPEARSGGAERRLGAGGCGFYEVSPEKRRVYAQNLSEKLGFDLEEEEEEWHLFAVEIESAAFVIIADEKQSVQVWPEAGE